MNSVVLLYLAAFILKIQAAPSLPPLPVNPGGIGGLFRGPNQETIIRGPDGSEITSEQLGGSVQSGGFLQPIVVPDLIPATEIIEPPPEVIPISNNIEPSSANPTLVQQVAVEEDPHIIETEFVDAPEIEPNQNSDLKRPSGSISVRGSSSIVSGPASTTISEPVRMIQISDVPIVAPSTILVPPVPGLDNLQGVGTQEIIGLNPPPLDGYPTSHNLQQQQSLNSEFFPPIPENGEVSSVKLSVTPQSVTPIPTEALPPNTIDLGQTVVSTTQKSIIPSPNADIDASRIILGNLNNQQLSVRDSVLSSPSSVPPSIPSSTSAPSLSSTLTNTPQQNTLQQNKPLFTTASNSYNLQSTIPSSILTAPPQIFIPNIEISSPEQSVFSNQVAADVQKITSSNGVGSTPAETGSNVPSSWVKVEDDRVLQVTSGASGNNLSPISTVLDTVLVQPTDPKNREVIEFGGKQLENVGNIVPVIHHPVLVTGGLTHLHHIPAASVSQLTSREDPNRSYERYERDVDSKN